jgi:rod shape-determining protein MreD
MSQSNLPGFLLSLLLALVLQVVGLPDVIAPGRPLLLALTLAYWSVYAPEMPVLVAAWLLGLCCDVLYDTPLGQYALGLTAVTYAARKLASLLQVYPIWQGTLVMVPVWLGYILLMFWIDGLTHHQADAMRRWLPLLSTSLLWPVAVGLLSLLRSRRNSRNLLN